MASLKQIISWYRDEIVDGGNTWVAIFKTGRSWNAQAFYPEGGNHEDGFVFDGFDVEEMENIVEKDHKAICINGYYTNWKELSLSELENKISYFYNQRLHQLHGDFLECMVIPPAC